MKFLTSIVIFTEWKMVRDYERKTSRALVEPDVILAAVKDVLLHGTKVHRAAKNFNLNYKSLGRYVDQVRDKNVEELTASDIQCGFRKDYRLVLSSNAEEELVKYILRSAEIFYGLSPARIRKLAYEYAIENYGSSRVPESWVAHETAGADWFSAFMKRHPVLSLRTPQSTSLARARGFNQMAVKLFHDNYEKLIEKWNFTPNNIWNIDESGLTTVPDPPKVVGKKGQKQIGQIASAERGELITIVMAVSACGNKAPPFLIFPRKKFQDFMVETASKELMEMQVEVVGKLR